MGYVSGPYDEVHDWPPKNDDRVQSRSNEHDFDAGSVAKDESGGV